MKRTIFTRFAMAALAVAAISCQREDALGDGAQNGPQKELTPLVIKATLEDGATKTALQTGGKVHWESGDAITVLGVGADAAVNSYKFTTENDGEEATFTNAGGVTLAKDYYVIYPHTDTERLAYLKSGYKTWSCTVEDSKLRVYFPSMQKVSAIGESSTSIDAYSVGVVAEDATVAFKNLGGLIEINIPEEGIEHVIIYGNANETIVGNAYVTFGEDGLPVISSVDGSNMVRIVPATGKTFSVGKYYINVLPVNFVNGLSIIYTKSDDTWAIVRSSNSFTVERSKISTLPKISSLKFGGKVVDIIAVPDVGDPGNPFTKALPDSKDNEHKNVEVSYTLKNTNHIFKFKATTRHYRTTNSGLCYGQGIGDYLEIPAIEGFALNKIVARNSADGKQAGNTVICYADNTQLEDVNVWTGDKKPYGIEHIWSFGGNANTAYRITRTTSSSDYASWHQIRLYYADAPEGESTINPLITSVNTSEMDQADIEPASGTVTFRGSFTAVDYQSSLLSCGFDYKPVSATEWTTVTCTEAANEFSYEETINSAEDYVYRAWTKVNKTGKTVYGEEVQFNPKKLVLHLVFDDNYFTREDDYNFLLREWKWGTNGNSPNENLNGETYNYNYYGADYPFTFWSYRVSDTETADKGGYSLWVASGSQKVYGLSLSYSKATDNFDPVAWMLLPGPSGARLIKVETTLKDSFAGTISSAVGEDGRPDGEPIASFVDRYKNIKLTLEGTTAGTRYYFCTDDDNQPTLRNLTLTYLYE